MGGETKRRKRRRQFETAKVLIIFNEKEPLLMKRINKKEH